MSIRIPWKSLSVICSVFVTQAFAHPVITLTESVVSQPHKGSKEKPTSAEFPARLVLGRKYVAFEAQDSCRIYDFERRRIYDLNLKDKTFQEAALYSEFSARALEMQNRISLNEVFDRAKAMDASQAPALLEHLFSIPVEDQGAPIDKVQVKGDTAFSWERKDLFTISDKTRPLPADSQREYWQWLRYTFGGHPKIYADVSKRQGVPELIKIVRPDVTPQTVTLRLTNVTDEPDAPYSLSGFKPASIARSPYPTLAKVGANPRAAFNASAEAEKKERDAATAQGRLLDAALAHFAYALSTGDAGNDWLTQVRDRMSEDQDAIAFAASLSAKDRGEAARAVQTLTGLRAKSKSPYAYLLDVFTANHEGSQKHMTAAEKLFVSALNANPYLTGAWFDLGKLYYATSRTREAWACWDAARAINPDHPFGKEIGNMERRMVEDQPEWF